MAKQKGSPKTGGRKKGTPNQATAGIRELAQRLTVGDKAYMANLRKRLNTGECAPYLEGRLWEYAFGKPKDQPPSGGPPLVLLRMYYPENYDPLADPRPPDHASPPTLSAAPDPKAVAAAGSGVDELDLIEPDNCDLDGKRSNGGRPPILQAGRSELAQGLS